MYDNNTTTEFCNNYPWLIESIQQLGRTEKVVGSARVVIITAFVTLSMIGAVGNICMIVSMLSNRDKRSSIRCAFAVNLAVSDLILCVFTQPLNLLQQLDREWHYGNALCRLLPTIQSINVFTSSFSITAISIDRLHAVVQPHSKRPEHNRYATAAGICAIWLVAILLSTPLVFFYSTATFPPQYLVEEFKACLDKFRFYEQCIYGARESVNVGYTLASLFVWFFLNCIVMLVAHLCIWSRIVESRNRMEQAQTRSGAPSPGNSVTLKRAESSVKTVHVTTQTVVRYRKRKAKCLLIVIVITFVVSWLPINLLNLATDIQKLTRSAAAAPPAEEVTEDSPSASSGAVIGTGAGSGVGAGAGAGSSGSSGPSGENTIMNNVVTPLCNGLIFLSACLNPIFYGWLNDSCRQQFLSCYDRHRAPPSEVRQLHDSKGNLADNGDTNQSTRRSSTKKRQEMQLRVSLANNNQTSTKATCLTNAAESQLSTH